MYTKLFGVCQVLLDSSSGFEGTSVGSPDAAVLMQQQQHPTQERMATACFRFVDCATQFHEGPLALLLRAVEGNSAAARARWWNAIRQCRRRRQGPWTGLPVGEYGTPLARF